MAGRAKAKAASGTQNDRRPNGKAWKDGLSPEERLHNAKGKAAAKRVRKEMDRSNATTDAFLEKLNRVSYTTTPNP